MSGVEKSSEERIQERAHALWEQDGRPEGRSEEYWEQARRELEESEKPTDEEASSR